MALYIYGSKSFCVGVYDSNWLAWYVRRPIACSAHGQFVPPVLHFGALSNLRHGCGLPDAGTGHDYVRHGYKDDGFIAGGLVAQAQPGALYRLSNGLREK